MVGPWSHVDVPYSYAGLQKCTYVNGGYSKILDLGWPFKYTNGRIKKTRCNKMIG